MCPNCKRFTHARELEELATRARQLVALGQLQAAREQWVSALRLLPPESSQYRAVGREIQKIDQPALASEDGLEEAARPFRRADRRACQI